VKEDRRCFPPDSRSRIKLSPSVVFLNLFYCFETYGCAFTYVCVCMKLCERKNDSVATVARKGFHAASSWLRNPSWESRLYAKNRESSIFGQKYNRANSSDFSGRESGIHQESIPFPHFANLFPPERRVVVRMMSLTFDSVNNASPFLSYIYAYMNMYTCTMCVCVC